MAMSWPWMGWICRLRRGSVYGLLGPNGAGKTTAVSILATLLVPDSGSARVAGADVLNEPALVRERIGAVGPVCGAGRASHRIREPGHDRTSLPVGKVKVPGAGEGVAGGLRSHRRRQPAGQGPTREAMRRRLDLAGALVASPPVLFLDEPTTGLDPRRPHGPVGGVIRELVARGSTLLLTTQYLEEADHLADRDHGDRPGAGHCRGNPRRFEDPGGGRADRGHRAVLLGSPQSRGGDATVRGGRVGLRRSETAESRLPSRAARPC